MLHHNAPAHSMLLIHDFLAKLETAIIPLPLQLLDLTPADFFLFLKLKFTLKG